MMRILPAMNQTNDIRHVTCVNKVKEEKLFVFPAVFDIRFGNSREWHGLHCAIKNNETILNQNRKRKRTSSHINDIGD